MKVSRTASLGYNFIGSYKKKSVDIFDYSFLSIANPDTRGIPIEMFCRYNKVESLLKILLNFVIFMSDETSHHTTRYKPLPSSILHTASLIHLNSHYFHIHNQVRPTVVCFLVSEAIVIAVTRKITPFSLVKMTFHLCKFLILHVSYSKLSFHQDCISVFYFLKSFVLA